MYDHVKWLRNGAVAGRDVFVTRYDDVWYDPHATNRYRLCVENVASKVCSNQVTVAPVQATAPGNLKQTPSPGRVALPSSLATCSIGFVWRVARPSDLVCVTPGSRSRVAEENRTAATRVQPGGGAYGPNTCRIGYVWRGAFDGDAVCVTPQVRTLVAEENQLAASRRAAAVQQTSPGSLKLGSLPSKAAFR
jgi:hypothetical protein